MVTGDYQWDFTVVLRNLPALLQGLGVTLRITTASIIIGCIVGALVAYAKGSRFPLLRTAANAFTDAFRAIPVLVMMIWLFYSFPSITAIAGFPAPVRLDPESASIVALAIYLAAQLADILRAGIDSIPAGQYDVSRTLGLSQSQIIVHIQVPQVLSLTLPAILGQFASTLLLSSLASVVAAEELLHQAQNIITNQYHALEVYTAVALIYLAVAWPLTYFAKRLGRQRFSSRERFEDLSDLDVAIPHRTATLSLEVQSVTVRSEKDDVLLDNVSLYVAPGTVLGVFGPSGAGKSTLIRILGGLEAPSYGTCSWQDLKIQVNRFPRFGYVPQGLYLWPHLSASENVALALRLVEHKNKSEANQVAHHWLQQLGLGHRLDAKPGTLSGGEAQRVAIARALAVNPEVFLLDEITSSLDPELIGQIVDVLFAIVRSGATVVITSHNLNSVYRLIDKAIFLDRGRVVDFGDKAEVFSGRVPRVHKFLARQARWIDVPFSRSPEA